MKDAASKVTAPLPRSLGVIGVLLLTLSVTTPASSLFVIVPGMLQAAGTGAIWAIAIAAVICVATAFVYAELSSAWPVAGGEYVMVAKTLGSLPGFVMLGVNVFNNLLFPPVAALGVSALLGPLVPGLPQVPIAILILSAATVVSILKIRLNAWITGLFLLVEILAVGAVAWVGITHAHIGIGAMILHPLMPQGRGLVPASASAIGVATTIAVFALNGYGVAVYFGEEMHEAPRRIAHAILWSLWLALLLEAIPLILALVSAPELRAFATAQDPFGALVRALAGPRLATAVALGVVVAIFNAVIAAILATARFFYGTGRDGSWGNPIDLWLTSLHPSWASPWLATLLVGAIGIACCFLPLTFLLVASGAGLIVIYAGVALAAMVGRSSGATAGAGYRMPLYPLWPVLTLAALIYVGWTNWLDVEEGRPALLATVAQMVGSACYYVFVLRRRGSWEIFIPE